MLPSRPISIAQGCVILARTNKGASPRISHVCWTEGGTYLFVDVLVELLDGFAEEVGGEGLELGRQLRTVQEVGRALRQEAVVPAWK